MRVKTTLSVPTDFYHRLRDNLVAMGGNLSVIDPKSLIHSEVNCILECEQIAAAALIGYVQGYRQGVQHARELAELFSR